MVQRKLNKKRVAIAISILVGIVVFIIFIISLISGSVKKNSIEYKLENLGYNTTEIEYIKTNLSEEEQNKILSMDYSSMIVLLYKEKFFKKDKLDDYLKYYKTNRNSSAKEIITKVNTHTNVDFYDEIFDADLTKNELVLVNKYYKLGEDYEPEVELLSSQYAYSGRYVSKSIISPIENLIEAAKADNIKLIVSAGYRSYKDQEKIYNNYKVSNGIREADENISRPGHSDYQTGLGIDVEPYAKTVEVASESDEYKWLMNNMHNYGFIQRFPEGTEEITGFKYNPWHLGYVGIEAATYIHNNNITLEEYYGYKF